MQTDNKDTMTIVAIEKISAVYRQGMEGLCGQGGDGRGYVTTERNE